MPSIPITEQPSSCLTTPRPPYCLSHREPHRKKIAEFLDLFLQPTLSSIPSFVKDTGNFLYILQNLGPLPNDTLLVMFDVALLYTNIPLAEAERSVARMLLQSRPQNATPSNPRSHVSF